MHPNSINGHIEQEMLKFFRPFTGRCKSPMGGNARWEFSFGHLEHTQGVAFSFHA